MAESLLYLYDHIFEKQTINYITKKDLGELTAMTLESATRVLKEFMDESIIEIKDKEITINNSTALEKIAMYG